MSRDWERDEAVDLFRGILLSLTAVVLLVWLPLLVVLARIGGWL